MEGCGENSYRYCPIQFSIVMLNSTLHDHRVKTENVTIVRLNKVIPHLAERAGATGQSKTTEPFKWAQRMNVCKAQTEEIIFEKIICS